MVLTHHQVQKSTYLGLHNAIRKWFSYVFPAPTLVLELNADANLEEALEQNRLFPNLVKVSVHSHTFGLSS